MRAKLANWTDISDVALLKRLRNSEEWLRWVCIGLLRENAAYRLEEATSRSIRIVGGTIVREPDKTGSQWRILYSIRLPSLACDFFEVTATIGEGSGESLKLAGRNLESLNHLDQIGQRVCLHLFHRAAAVNLYCVFCSANLRRDLLVEHA